jgi:hypothetical protein
MNLPSPEYMSMHDWCAQMGAIIGHLRQITPLDGDDWVRWGQQFLLVPGISVLGPPDPARFDNWARYGESLVNSLGNIDGTLGNKF